MATTKQKKAFKKTLENGGVVSTAMAESDYSPAMAKNPQKLTNSKGWKELMDEHLSDKLLAERHLELLNKREIHRVGVGDDMEYEVSDQPDTQAVSKALDMAYRLKGSYAPEKSITATLNLNDEQRNKAKSAIKNIAG